MGFSEAKKLFLAALRDGRVDHETRAAKEDKNWIVSGRTTVSNALEIIGACRGNDARQDAHHAVPGLAIWILKPKYQGSEWYIKGYLIGDDVYLVELRLLSFHPSVRKE